MSFAFHQFSDRALSGQIAWGGGVWSAVLIASSWTPDPTDVFVTDIDVSHRPRPALQIGGRTLVDGAADCFDFAFPRVPVTGHIYQGVVIFQDTAIPATSRLAIFHDSAPEWPVTPNGGNIVVQIDAGVNRLFRIGTFPA